ncbi:DNA-directed DNA polymerase [Zostera marina]|uniref:DNA-directed DNA polymerase n=1 Tax=Zostera marina TaxID=29655 RepID=A0A0K9PBU1_ZOSMR|nr:DNA-directed DNA polymerase [Zostera marina]
MLLEAGMLLHLLMLPSASRFILCVVKKMSQLATLMLGAPFCVVYFVCNQPPCFSYLRGILDKRQGPRAKSILVNFVLISTACSIWGLKQAPPAWLVERLSSFILSLNFRNSFADSSLFIRKASGDRIYVIIYVDNFIIIDTPVASGNQLSSISGTPIADVTLYRNLIVLTSVIELTKGVE